VRVLAVIGALILGLVAAGFTAAVIDGYDIPTCEQVRSGEEPASEDNECADTGETQNQVSNVTGTIAAALGLLAAIALFLFGVTGNGPWARRSAVLLVSALVVFGLTALITNA
jgi:hypothetical protein